jgi:hypothetical protein
MQRDLAHVMAFDNGNRPLGAGDELRSDLSSPDALTPAQYYPAPAANPYQRLLIAILEDAIRCYQSNFAVRNGPRRILFRETEEWVFDSDGAAFLSCSRVCESLGVNSVQLRRFLREWHLRMKAGNEARVQCGAVPFSPIPTIRYLTFLAHDGHPPSRRRCGDAQQSRATLSPKRPARMRI